MGADRATGNPVTEATLSLLIVDDVEENLLAVEAALEPLGHRLVRARSGEEALRHLLREDAFAAVVLDVQMPGLDGFATAEAIRQRPRTSDLPIIFLTAISRDDEHRLRGFATGAVDYIFKPVDPEVLRAKVSVFVRLYAADRALRRQSEDLRRQAAALARSNADLDQFASVVSHDLVDPLNVISGYLELLSDAAADRLDDRSKEWIRLMEECARRMHTLVGDLLAYARSTADADGTHRCELSDALADATANLGSLLSATGSSVRVDGPLPAVPAGRPDMARILQNLIGNSATHAGRPAHIDVSARTAAGEVTVSVADDGPGLDPLQMERVFGLFERGDTSGPTPSTGLGLAICRRIVQRLGGRIWMEPGPEGGARVSFTVPAVPAMPAVPGVTP